MSVLKIIFNSITIPPMKEGSPLTAEQIQTIEERSGCFKMVLDMAVAAGSFLAVLRGGSDAIGVVLNSTMEGKKSTDSK